MIGAVESLEERLASGQIINHSDLFMVDSHPSCSAKVGSFVSPNQTPNKPHYAY
jgi:hypothetical protein